MSRDPYRSSGPDLSYGGRGPQRWDMDRFQSERDRNRYADRYEERDTRVIRESGGRPRERSEDDIYESRGPRGFEEERFQEKVYYDDDDPRYREPPSRRSRGESITIDREREREVYNASPPRRAPGRPTLLRRQSSLDTFDRKPFPRYPREEYGPPARRPEYIPEPLPPIPLPRSRGLPPPRRYAERDYEEIKIADPDYYGDEDYRPYPERVLEREIIRTRRRSRSRGSRARSVSSSSSSSSDAKTVKSEFPKRGKTRMPARLVSKRAIIDLGYPFEEEGSTIIILKALGRENIDEVIKLSEDYKSDEKVSGGRSHGGGEIIEERKVEEIYRGPAPAVPQIFEVSPNSVPREAEIIEKTTIERREEIPYRQRSHSVGPLVLAVDPNREDERTIRAKIRALEAEQDAIRAEKRAQRELDKATRIRIEGRGSSEVILYEREERKEREPEGVSVIKDKKGPNPRAVRAMLKTLT